MRLSNPRASGMVLAVVIACFVGTARVQGIEGNCKSVTVFAALGDEVTVTLDAPVVEPTQGVPPYTITPDADVPVSLTGTPGDRFSESYSIQDSVGGRSTCAIFIGIRLELSVECQPDLVVNVASGMSGTATLEGPIAVASDGDDRNAYTFEPDVNTAISVSGEPGTSEVFTYTVTDSVGNTAQCSVRLSVGLEACAPGDNLCEDPHMKGLRGQKIDWSGVNGGWYSLVKDEIAELEINVRLTAPLPEAFPDRQLMTGLSILSGEHSVVIEVKNPYDTATDGCPDGVSRCLANGGLRVAVDGKQDDGLPTFFRDERVADGIEISASNLPVECRQFGGDRIWAHMYDEMLQGKRQLATYESFESWILRFDHMAASDWCEQYIAQHDLVDVQSIHAIFKIVTPAVTVRLNAGVNYQGDDELDWDGRVLPDLEFWQMDVGFHGLSLENESLSGILGETARPVLDKEGREVMEGYDAFRGTVEDYRVSGPLGTDFALLEKDEYQE